MTMIAPFDLLSRSHSRRFKSPVYRKNWNEGKIFGTPRSSVKVSGVAWKNVTSIRGISQLYTHVRQYANSLENKIYIYTHTHIYIYKERESFLVSTGKKKKKKKEKKIKNPERSARQRVGVSSKARADVALLHRANEAAHINK